MQPSSRINTTYKGGEDLFFGLGLPGELLLGTELVVLLPRDCREVKSAC